jgi:acetyl esterase/lipase
MTIEHFPPRGGLETALAALLRATLQMLLKPVFSARVPIPFQRVWLRLLARTTLVPRGTVFEPATVGGVPGEWVRPREAPTRAGTLLYLHGGA